MNKDIVDIRLSKRASDIANRFREILFFPDAISVAKLGFAYKLTKTSETEILGFLMLSERKKDDRFDSNGNNYAGASIDQGGRMSKVITTKFPDCDIPHQYIRLLMDAGLCELGEKISSLDDFKIFLKTFNSQFGHFAGTALS